MQADYHGGDMVATRSGKQESRPSGCCRKLGILKDLIG
jgi:hypothetical protein